MPRRLSRVLFPLVLALSLPSRSVAQDASTGAIRGSVVDPDGNRVARATITLLNVGTGIVVSGSTNEDGRFAFELLTPGDYTARGEAPGMSPQITPRVHVDVGGALEIELRLGLAGNKETITVSAHRRWSKRNRAPFQKCSTSAPSPTFR